jgi:glycosyltransferase involved in cell wall biosynthesis
MTHIGIDARLTCYRVGGISTYTRQLIHALEQLDTYNRYTVFRSRKARDSVSTRFAEAVLWTPPHHRLERLALSAELMRFNLDVLHSPDFIPPLRGARRYIITVHDLTFLHFPEHKDAEAVRYYNHQIGRAVRQADHILAVSEATKRDLISMLGVPASMITVQPHGVDEHFQPLPEQALQAWQARLDLPAGYILFVGTLEPRKNVPALLDAYELLSQQYRHELPALLLVGRRGWLFGETMARIVQMQADGTPITIRSDIDDDALPAVYNLAKVLVMPSLYEGFGLPVLEAMACGTPVIASNRSSLPEVVGDAGELIDPDNPAALATALERALFDDDWHRASREAGLERTRKFSWSRSAEIAMSVYHGVA